MTAAAVKFVQGVKQAAVLLEPTRLRLLEALAEPQSASGLARTMKLPRQRINYHIRALESAGLVKKVGQRRKGNCIERLVKAVAHSYLVSPEALGNLATDPSRVADKLSSSYLVAVAARTIRDLAVLQTRADKVGKPLATMTLQADVRFASAQDRGAFAEELAGEVARLTAKYHNESAEGGRLFRFFLGAYPAITKTEEEADAEHKTTKKLRNAGQDS